MAAAIESSSPAHPAPKLRPRLRGIVLPKIFNPVGLRPERTTDPPSKDQFSGANTLTTLRQTADIPVLEALKGLSPRETETSGNASGGESLEDECLERSERKGVLAIAMSPNGSPDRTREGFVGFPLAVTWNTLGDSLELASQRARRPGGERTGDEKLRSAAADERARWAMVVPKMDRRT